jgi:hypothetical protein
VAIAEWSLRKRVSVELIMNAGCEDHSVENVV